MQTFCRHKKIKKERPKVGTGKDKLKEKQKCIYRILGKVIAIKGDKEDRK